MKSGAFNDFAPQRIKPKSRLISSQNQAMPSASLLKPKFLTGIITRMSLSLLLRKIPVTSANAKVLEVSHYQVIDNVDDYTDVLLAQSVTHAEDVQTTGRGLLQDTTIIMTPMTTFLSVRFQRFTVAINTSRPRYVRAPFPRHLRLLIS